MLQHSQGLTLALTLLLALPCAARAQSASAVSALDTNRYMGIWYEQAHLPNRSEKKCVSDGLALYALADKNLRFQLVTSCVLKDGNTDSHNLNGKLSKTGDGRLRVTHLWPFSASRWVIAIDPQYEWALVGSSSHNSLWILTRAETVEPATLTEIKARATAQGFNTAKLVSVPQLRSSVASEKAEGPHSK